MANVFFFFFFEKNKSRGKKISLFNLYPVFYPITQIFTLGTSTFIKKTEDDNAVNENTLENAIFKSLKTCSANGIFYLLVYLCSTSAISDALSPFQKIVLKQQQPKHIERNSLYTLYQHHTNFLKFTLSFFISK